MHREAVAHANNQPATVVHRLGRHKLAIPGEGSPAEISRFGMGLLEHDAVRISACDIESRERGGGFDNAPPQQLSRNRPSDDTTIVTAGTSDR